MTLLLLLKVDPLEHAFLALHRSDVAAALGLPADLTPSEARAGIRWSAALLGPMTTFSDDPPPGSLAVEPSDAEAILLGEGEPAATARGTAADLVFWLWGRGRGGVELAGSGSVADAWSTLSGRTFQHEAIA